MKKEKKPTPAPFSFSKKWVIWSAIMLVLSILGAKDEIGINKQLNMFVSILVLFVLVPYFFINLRRFRKIRKKNKEDAIPGYDDIDKSLFSPFSVTKMITGLGYTLLILFIVSLISTFFQKIDFVTIFGQLFLISLCAGMLFSRKYVFSGSKFWRIYLIGSLITIMLFDIAFLFGTVATVIVFPLIFIYSLWIIIGVIKNRPTTTGESPYKWLALALTLTPLVTTIVCASVI